MKIVLAVHHFLPKHTSGAELLTYRTARWLIEHGHRVRVVCVDSIDNPAYPDKVTWADETFAGIPVRRLTFHLPTVPETLRTWFTNPLLQDHFDDWFFQDRPDLVHLIGGYLLGVAPLDAARRLNIPTVITLTDFWFLCHTIRLLRGDGTLCTDMKPIECVRCIFDGKRAFGWLDQRVPGLVQNFWRAADNFRLLGAPFQVTNLLATLQDRQRQLREALSSADAVITLTRFLKDIHAEHQFQTQRWQTIHLATDFEFSATTPARPTNRPIHFGYLGQIVSIKGVDLLVKAFRKLDRTQRDARLTIFGGLDAEPDYTQQLRALAEGDPTVTFAGRYGRADLNQILSELDCIVVPSIWYENGPTVILEAFAAQRPVIGTALGGIAELVQHDVNGLLFDRKDVADLARQMQRILDEPALLPRLQRNIPRARMLDQEMLELSQIYEQVIVKQSVPDKETI